MGVVLARGGTAYHGQLGDEPEEVPVVQFFAQIGLQCGDVS